MLPLLGGPIPVREQGVELLAIAVEQRLVVLHRKIDAQSLLQPAIKIDEMLVRIVEQRPVGQQTEVTASPPQNGSTRRRARATPTRAADTAPASAFRPPTSVGDGVWGGRPIVFDNVSVSYLSQCQGGHARGYFLEFILSATVISPEGVTASFSSSGILGGGNGS